MNVLIKKNFLCCARSQITVFLRNIIIFLYIMTPLHASPSYDYSVIAEQCRQVALKLDWLSRYQDRTACTSNLDGLNIYIASKYILNNQLEQASALITHTVFSTQFAFDIGCYGQDDIKLVTLSLQTIQKAIAKNISDIS